MPKTFVLDTNVLIHRPDAFLTFEGRPVIIPFTVLEELDHLKGSTKPAAPGAREAIRRLAEVSFEGSLLTGVTLPNGTLLKVLFPPQHSSFPDLKYETKDNEILALTLSLQAKEKECKVIFVSKDLNARIKASALGVGNADYTKDLINASDLSLGFVDKSSLKGGELLPPNTYVLEPSLDEDKGFGKLSKNTVKINGQSSLEAVRGLPQSCFGVSALNLLQQAAFDAVLDKHIPVVFLMGGAGTGKTLIAIAGALHNTLERNLYKSVLITRPTISMGKDIGYMPGGKAEKMASWLRPIYDNLDFIMRSGEAEKLRSTDYLVQKKKLEIESLSFIRGRTLSNQIVIVDEAQNMTPHEVKTVISRMGKRSKIILTGDLSQIDRGYLDERSSGLSYAAKAFLPYPEAAMVTLQASERGSIAELANKIL